MNYAVIPADVVITHKPLKLESILMWGVAHSFFFTDVMRFFYFFFIPER
jgi:hypothetical protein